MSTSKKYPFPTTPAMVKLQDDFLKAKENEEGWKVHKEGLRGNLFNGLEAMGLKWPESGTVELEKLSITMAAKMELNQAAIIALFQKFPAQASAFFRVEYKASVDRETLENACKVPGEFSDYLSTCFHVNPPEKRVSARKK